MSRRPKKKGLQRIIGAFFYSINGIKACFRTEEAFRQEVMLAVVMVPLGLYLGSTMTERLLLSGSVCFVLIVELLNTSIERAIDRISSEEHELSKESKDMGSAAVLLSLIMTAMLWAALLCF